jgi:Fe2+ transport system protein FeoA
MENGWRSHFIFRNHGKKDEAANPIMNLSQAKMNTQYIIKNIKTEDEELKNFLFTLGCYKGEEITVISVLSDHYTIYVKDARYSIDKQLAESIII